MSRTKVLKFVMPRLINLTLVTAFGYFWDGDIIDLVVYVLIIGLVAITTRIIYTWVALLRDTKPDPKLTSIVAEKTGKTIPVYLTPKKDILGLSIGFPKKKILISEHFRKAFDEDILPILFHEVGHIVHRHSEKIIVASLVSFILSALAGYYLQIWGFAVAFITFILFNYFRHKMEYVADQYSASYFGEETIIRVLKTYGADPDLWLLKEYPSIEKRINNLKNALIEYKTDSAV